jgi:DNA-directed RNA polymerase specialized sigma24 family protein
MREVLDPVDTEPPDRLRFDDFYREELNPLILFLYRQRASWDEAWDAAHDAFAQALRCWDTISSPPAWVRTTAMRCLRARRGRRWSDLNRAVQAGWAPRPRFDDLSVPEEAAAVMRMLRRLPPRQSQVMALAVDGFKPYEMAEILNISMEAARSNLRHARKSLAAMMEVEGLTNPLEGPDGRQGGAL